MHTNVDSDYSHSTDQTLDFAHLKMSVATISNTLKRYLAMLPDPLIPQSLSMQLLSVVDNKCTCDHTHHHVAMTSACRLVAA